MLQLEDEFGDIIRKAMRGTGVGVGTVSRDTGIDKHALDEWMKYRGAPSDGEAREIARVLRLDPGALADSAAKAWYPPDIDLPDVHHHPHDPHPSNGYVFFLDGRKRAALVDPAGIPGNLLRMLREGAYHLQYILVTHKHADH